MYMPDRDDAAYSTITCETDYVHSNEKQTMSMDTFRETCQTGDILLLRGTAWYSRWIEYLGHSKYSHVAIILRDPTYIDPKLKGLYILESGAEGCVDSVRGEKIYGVQIVPFEESVRDYLHAGAHGNLFYRRLNCVRNDTFIERLENTVREVYAKPYDIHPTDWLRAKLEMDSLDEPRGGGGYFWSLGTQQTDSFWNKGRQHTDSFWCSALVAYVYVRLGFLETAIPWSLIAPRQFSALEGDELGFAQCTVQSELELTN